MVCTVRFVKAIQSTVWMILLLSLLSVVSSACRPVFEDNQCAQDTDCFTDQYCGPTGTCLLKSGAVISIVNFSADVSSGKPGDMVTFSWKTRGGTSALISGPDDFSYMISSAEVAEGTTTVALPELPNQQVDYTITVRWDEFEKNESISIQIEEDEVNPPTIDSFESDAQDVDPGALVKLSWEVSLAQSGEVRVDGQSIHELGEDELESGSLNVNPMETTTYELQVTNEDGTDSAQQTVTVVVPMAPTITDFSAGMGEIYLGDSVNVSWITEGADVIEIVDADDMIVFTSNEASETESGSTDVSPTQDASYTLIARNDYGEVSSSPLDITVVGAPTVTSFVASKSSDVVPDSMIDLSWETVGAESVEIRDADMNLITSSDMNTGSVSVTITANTTFTLSATNPAGTITQDVTVTLLGSPSITSFTASKSTDVLFNEMIDLSWEAVGAEGIEIRDADMNLITSSDMNTGSVSVAITADTTFTLVVSNAAGSVSQDLSVTMLTPPTITSFTGSETTDIAVGTNIDLSWETVGAESIEIRDADMNLITSSTMNTGSASVTVTADTTFTLSATNPAGSVSQDVVVTVLVVPSIVSFTADTTSTYSGQAVVLSWETQDTVALEIEDDQGGPVTSVMSNSIAMGSLQFRPQVTTVYTLRARGMGGVNNEVTQQITISVSAAPLMITEVLFDPMMPVSGRQWVEIYNAGDTFVDLTNYSLGWTGISSFADYRQAFEPNILAPGATFVVGEISDAQNHMPSLDQASGFTPVIGDGSMGVDGVALFFIEAQNVTSTSVPVDSVIWGTSNTKMLPDESGAVDVEISAVPASGNSLVRVSATHDVFVDSQAGFPNTPMFVQSISPVRFPNTATQGTFDVVGFGFDLALDTFVLGTTPLSCATSMTGLTCQLDLSTPSTDSGYSSFVGQRVSEYVQDAQGAPVVSPRVAPLTYTLLNAVFLEAMEQDMSADFECATRAPATAVVSAGMPITLEVEVYALGVTDGGMLPPDWVIQAGYYDVGVTPYDVISGVTWQQWDVMSDSRTDDAINTDNDVFALDVTSAVTATQEAAFRISQDGGTTWIYCNAASAGGSSAGWTSGVSVEWN